MDRELKKKLAPINRRKEKAKKENNLAKEAKLCKEAGKILLNHRVFEDALKEYRRNLQLSECLREPLDEAIAHRRIGDCQLKLKHFKEALSHYEKYLELSRKAKDIVGQQQALAAIGKALLESGTDCEAQSKFFESFEICKTKELQESVTIEKLQEMRAGLYLNLGLVFYNLNNQEKCILYRKKALDIARDQNLEHIEYKCYYTMGVNKLTENCLDEALECFERAMKTAQHQRDKFEETDALIQIGHVLLLLGNFKRAKDILKKCWKHGDRIHALRLDFIKAIKGARLLKCLQKSDREQAVDKDGQIKSYEDLGDFCSKIECYTEAIKYYQKQFELSEELNKPNEKTAVICHSIACSYLDLKQYEKAKDYFHKELQLREGEEQKLDALWNIAEMTELAAFDDMQKAYTDALENARKCKTADVKKLRAIKVIEHRLSELGKMRETIPDATVEKGDGTSEEQSEEQSHLNGDDEDEEGGRLIQEEMGLPDFDEEQRDSDKRFTVKVINKRKERTRLKPPQNSDVVSSQKFSENISRKTETSKKRVKKRKLEIRETDSHDDITPAKDREKFQKKSLAVNIDADVEMESDSMDLEGSTQKSQSDHSDPLDTQQIPNYASMPSESLTLPASRQSIHASPSKKHANSSSSSTTGAQPSLKRSSNRRRHNGRNTGSTKNLKQTILVPSSRNELKVDKGTKKREF